MKAKYLLISIFFIFFGSFIVNAQTDLTSLIINPSFEDNVDDMATGWDYEGGCDAYAWHTINTDGDDTKDGDNICGLWNETFGDVAITQTLTGLENGVYVVTAGLMVGVNDAAPGQRLTTQRIFANNNSVLYSSEVDYSAENLDILSGTLEETLSYADYPVSTVENGPFSVCSVETTVTDGTLVFGIKTNGTTSEYEFSFPDADESGWGWFKMDNFTLTLLDGSTAIENISNNNDFVINVHNGFISVQGVKTFAVYNISGNKIPSNKQLSRGIYIVKANSKVKKVTIQ
ncbi:MAG: hypothetical protein PF541_00500 [Prolixibacteraceae bacterium]|jgi:hypothetical protein|nr:hypothetical protein [Prolixibacteraceae bacterium]